MMDRPDWIRISDRRYKDPSHSHRENYDRKQKEKIPTRRKKVIIKWNGKNKIFDDYEKASEFVNAKPKTVITAISRHCRINRIYQVEYINE